MKFFKWINDYFFGVKLNVEIDLNGEWEGFFKYSQYAHHLLQKIQFDFTLTLTEENGDINGYFIEEMIGGEVDDKILCYGITKGRKIEFHKIYNTCYVLKEDGFAYEESAYNPPLVKYYGHFYPQENKYFGDWSMKYEIEGKRQYTSGYWEMRKKE
ncbi:hypothetical protein [Chondrinema litorale]|uniref:hypothetical protein n=1 Tax=Chondrinema litorale TaxID=2994555 RepID=UPI002543E925|nr:hypothetical protein [Chondrinema litorale]UZR96508.1 hypothetical protein OQ292_22895 [Chondrinema litorale]